MQTNAIDGRADKADFQFRTNYNASLRRARDQFSVMMPTAVLLLAILAFMSRSAGAQQATSSSPAQAGAQKMTRVVLPVSLTTALDSKKQKTGAEVIVKLGGTVNLKDGTAIPRGAKIVGHVTEAKARSGGDTESSLAIAFDTINLPDGKNLAIKGTMQAVAPNPNEDDSGGAVDYGSSMNRTMEHAQGGTSMSSPVTVLTEQSVGVYGFKNMQLGADGVLKSNDKSVKLASRSQIVLRAEFSAN